jgi:DNA gyrase subunit A
MAKAPAAVAPTPQPIGHTSIEGEMRRSYIDYAMSVIVARALPDARDGLKPVHRRILFGMKEGGYLSGKPKRKSAKIVGDVMGKYHPHGDAAIYDAMVRMVQTFSMRVPLVDGQGNFGSPDGDPPAAMRYTEARMARIADEAMVADLDEGTVDWRPNYDDTEEEPKVLPARFPNLLVNGGEGIAVGMATKIPPHNLNEIVDATLAYMDRPDMGVEDLMRIVQGPDFPTGGVIMGRGGIREALATGKGSIVISGVTSLEPLRGGKQAIVITELPYQVNKTKLLEKLADLVNDKTIEGVSDLRDESDEDAVRVVVELKRDANPELVLNKLRKHTDLVVRFGVNATCLDGRGDPRVMSALEIISEFVGFRRLCIRRRTIHRLEKARKELTKQVALYAARSKVDEVVATIRASSDREEARMRLMAMEFPVVDEFSVLLHEVDPDAELPPTYHLTDFQARNVLELRLQSLTALDQDEVVAEARRLLGVIRGLDEILNDPAVLDSLMRMELDEVKAKYGTPRLTRIESAGPADIDDEDLIEEKQVVLTMTKQGYVKTTELGAYREQSRGGKGRTGMDTKDGDFVTSTLVCSNKTTLIFFTSRGIAHTVKAYALPDAPANAKGRPLVNFLRLREGDGIATVLPMLEPEDAEGKFMVFATDVGDVRRNAASDFTRVQQGGKVAMKLEDEHGNQTARLISVMYCDEGDDVVLATRRGKAARFPVPEIRVFRGRDSTGNKGITLGDGDAVIASCIVRHFEATPQERDAFFGEGTAKWKDDDGVEQSLTLEASRMQEMRAAEQTILTVTAGGFGKRFSSMDFRTTGRGAQGVWVGQFGPATGDLAALFPVDEADGLLLVTDGGQAIRTRCSEIRVMGRPARGVRLFDLPEGQAIVDVARVRAEDDA